MVGLVRSLLLQHCSGEPMYRVVIASTSCLVEPVRGLAAPRTSREAGDRATLERGVVGREPGQWTAA